MPFLCSRFQSRDFRKDTSTNQQAARGVNSVLFLISRKENTRKKFEETEMKSHRRRQIIKPRSRLSAAGGAARQALQRPAAADERAADEDFLSDGGRTRCHLCHLRATPRGRNHTHVMAGFVQEKKNGDATCSVEVLSAYIPCLVFHLRLRCFPIHLTSYSQVCHHYHRHYFN